MIKMTNKNLRTGILTLALLFAATPAAHAHPLDGTWLGDEGQELKLSNGSLKLSVNNAEFEAGLLIARGTFTVAGANLTITLTHYHGKFLAEAGFAQEIPSDGWLSRDDLLAIVIAYYGELMAPFVDIFIRPMLDDMFITETVQVTNNVFTLLSGTFTRR